MNEAMTATPEQPNKSAVWISFIILALVTALAYTNAAHERAVFDDKVFIGPERMARIATLGEAFDREVWGNNVAGRGFYRPLMMASFELQDRAFDRWVQGYHVVNIVKHVIATVLLLGFLRCLLKLRGITGRDAELAALISAMVFGVHPIHAESVNSIFNGTSISVSIFAIAGLWWLMSRLQDKPFSAWLGFGLAYCMAILFKESALSLPGIAVALVFLMTEGTFWQRVRRFLPVFWMLLPIAAYFYLRSKALVGDRAPAGDEMMVMFEAASLKGAGYMERIGSVLAAALRALVWPWPQQVFYGKPEDLTVYLGGFAWVVLLVSSVVLYFRGRPSLAAGISFFLIAFLPASRLISTDGSLPHMADRYVYYPSIGMSIVLAFGAVALARRFSAKLVAMLALPIILVGAGITWNRNHDWSSDNVLFQSEYVKGDRNMASLRILVSGLWKRRLYDQLGQVCEENPEYFSVSESFSTICANTFIRTGDREQALFALEASLETDRDWLNAHLMMGDLLIQMGRKQEGADKYAYIINRLEDIPLKEFYKGLMYLQLYPQSQKYLELARKHMETAQRLNPTMTEVEPFIRRIDGRLDPSAQLEPLPETPEGFKGLRLPMPERKSDEE